MFQILFIEFFVPQAVFAIATCVQADIVRCATSLKANLANECSSGLLVMLQYAGGPRLCFEFHQTRCTPVHAGIAVQIQIFLGTDAAHITATSVFVLCRRWHSPWRNVESCHLHPGIALTTEASRPASLCDVFGIEIRRICNPKILHIKHVGFAAPQITTCAPVLASHWVRLRW